MLLAAMSNQGWDAGPGDPTVAGWIIFTGYLAVALAAGCAARNEAARGLDPLLWRLLAAACVILALNKQLDLHNVITAVGRSLARSAGWYGQRRQVQLVAFAGFTLAGLAALFWVVRRTGSDWRRHRLTWAGLGLLGLFLGLRAASIHHLDEALRIELGGIRLLTVIESAAIFLLFLSAWSAARPAPPAGRP